VTRWFIKGVKPGDVVGGGKKFFNTVKRRMTKGINNVKKNRPKVIRAVVNG
jgi:hypothetical protein